MPVRIATYQDLPGILEIYNDVIQNTTAVYSYQPHTLQMRRQWFYERIQNGFPVYVYEADGAVAGFSSYGHFRAWPSYKYTVENSVYVHTAFRGKGLSKPLLQVLIDDAVRKDFHAVIAGIDANNVVSIRLHQQLGFVEVAHFKQVGYKFGNWLDLKFFELLLPTPARPNED